MALDTLHPATKTEPEIWRSELEAAGWKYEGCFAWRCPRGFLWRGPYGAWSEMKRREQQVAGKDGTGE